MQQPEQKSQAVIIVGAHNETVELCGTLSMTIVGIVRSEDDSSHTNYPVLGTDLDIEELFRQHGHCAVVISPDLPSVRRKLDQIYTGVGFALAELVHESATISPSVRFGAGVVVGAGANISTDSTLGRCVKVNTCANITHDCKIGDYVTIAPSSVVLGRVTLDDESYLGAGAIVMPGLTVGRGATVGAGSIVTRNVPENTTVVGNPARQLKLD